MDILWNLIAFIVALGILVTIHEYGHFWVARKLGVKVLVFSFGFGKPLLQKVGKDGVKYYLSAFFLGGYVKMLDERESNEPLSAEDKAMAFNRQSVWARMAIVLAGPAANFILAIFLYWCMYLIGIKGITTELAEPPNATIAELAGVEEGDVIRSVDGVDVFVLHDVTKSIAKRLGEKSQIELMVDRKGEYGDKQIHLNLSNWIVDDKRPEILHSIGLYHPLEMASTEIGTVAPDGPANKAGIMVGDVITSLNGVQVSSWRTMGAIIANSPNKKVLVEVERNGELIPISVVIGSAAKNGKASGFIGVGNVPVDYSKYVVVQQYDFMDAFGLAIDETINMIALSSRLFLKLIKGEISTKSLSGPVSIAKGAGDSASIGIAYFIGFLAMISVNLGFINLLPVPMLDGGHFLYFAIEAIKGSPLSEKVQEFGLQVGMMLVFALMAVALFNDFSRIV